MTSVCPFVGVPVGAPKVAACARAVTVYISTSSLAGVGVALSATVPIRLVILLFVKVCARAWTTTVSVPVRSGKVRMRSAVIAAGKTE